MSYDLHITKAEHWIHSEKNPITALDLAKVSDLLDTHMGVPFSYQNGRLIINGADERVIGLMIEIANRIDARVQGDEGEYYDNEENKYPLSSEYLEQDFNIAEVDTPDEQKRFIESLRINDEILHPKYGTGKIIEILGKGMNTEFAVKFANEEKVRRLLAYYAPISF